MDYTFHFDSPLGGMTMQSDGQALCGLWFDRQNRIPTREETRLPVFAQTEEWLRAYFGGKVPDFTPPLHLSGTPFQKAVWEQLLTISYGTTATYGELAKRLGRSGRAAQAVGGAVGRNPVLLIVPCHRILGADGSLTGYLAGTDRKRALLQLENAEIPPRA